MSETRERVEEAFRSVASALGGVYHDDAPWRRPIVQHRTGDWLVTLAWEQLQQGAFTVLRAPFHNPERLRFAVRDERLMDDLLKTLGFLQDVVVGDRAFDRRFVVKANSDAGVRAVLAPPVRALLESQKKVDLRVLPGIAAAARYPARVDELHFREGWAITDVPRLLELFELVGEVLPRLDPGGGGAGDEAARLTGRLGGPGGRVRYPGAPLLLWDGDTPRREAAERLGHLGDPRAVEPLISALGDDDDEVVAAAVRALARIGDRRAVPPLTSLLGERDRGAGSTPLDRIAGEALEALGRGDLADAFGRALEGDAEPLRSAAGDERAEVVGALMKVVDSADFAARVEAARVLGALGATEALPLLRSKSSAWGMRTRLTEAAAAAIEEIEARAALPRPATPDTGPADTHPRPADGSEVDASTLPRSADPEGDDD